MYTYSPVSEQMAEIVMELAGVPREIAEAALAEHKEAWLAVDALLQKPSVSGDKHIPARPKVHTGHTSEQQTICDKGRWLQDQINAVFSVAHSKIRPPLDDLEQVPAASHPLEDQQVSVPVEFAETSGSVPGSVE
jgi:hypothetical protein